MTGWDKLKKAFKLTVMRRNAEWF